MRRSTIISIIMCMAFCMVCFAGCGSSSSEGTAEATESSQVNLDKSMGIVKSVDADKNEIVVNVMDMGDFSGEAPTGENGEMPSKPDGQPPEGFDGEPPEGSDGQPPTGENGEMPSMPDGQMPEGFEGQPPTGENGEMPSRPDGEDFDGKMPNMEEKTYKVSENVMIQDENGSTISLEDVAEGSFIEFTVSNDEIASVSLKKNTFKDKEEAEGEVI